MSSELCPFCGKSFKRLKTHLPHCKAASSSKTSEKGKKAAAVASSEDSPPPPPLSSTPSIKKKKKTTKADHLESISSLPPPNAKVPKEKKKSLRDLIEASKSDQVADGTRTGPKTGADKESLHVISAETKRRDAPKKTKTKTTTASKSKKTPQLVDSEVDQGDTRIRTRDQFWVSEEEKPDQDSGGGPQARISIQSAAAALGRANGTRQTDAAVLWERLQPVENREPKSKRPQRDATIAPPPPPLHASRHVTGFLPPSPALARLPGPLRLPLLGPPRRPAGAETTTAPPPPQLEAEKQNTAETKPTEAAVMQRRLGQVTLRELPEWLALRTPSRPREVVEMLQRGWRWYYGRYIDVKKGGVAGVGMLLAGYCVLSYVWTYPHTKRDRWRKYH
ncbi:unnamed protein product [Ophioblennius macclurei]